MNISTFEKNSLQLYVPLCVNQPLHCPALIIYSLLQPQYLNKSSIFLCPTLNYLNIK